MDTLPEKRGYELLQDPLLNKGSAFTLQERVLLDLQGFLPHAIETLDQQVARVYEAFQTYQASVKKHIFLRALQDTNEVLFYRFIVDHIEEALPIIYTPEVGEACEIFYHIYRRPRGLFISYPERDDIHPILARVASARTIKAIVVTDGERILGLGDQGSGGLGIPIGKLSLYTACAGVAPELTLPIVLDVGTNNQARLDDPEYMGWRHPRLTGNDYDEFVDMFVQGVKQVFPHVLLQFEDFAQQHAYPLLERYHDQLCTFNDDIQGTAAVTVATILSATRKAGVTFSEQRIAFLGAGSAGCGIAEQLVHMMMHEGLAEPEARARIYMIDRTGLLTDATLEVQTYQQKLLHKKASINAWGLDDAAPIQLMDVIRHAQPTILVGVSGQPHQFTEAMMRIMADYAPHPIILPLSNPTDRAEVTPDEVMRWTDGRALIATGSPFPPVVIEGKEYVVSQCNNTYIFPGVGLAVVAADIKRVTDRMMLAAAIALSEFAANTDMAPGALLPKLTKIREASRYVAKAVVLEAIQEGHAHAMSDDAIEQALANTMWEPVYRQYA